MNSRLNTSVVVLGVTAMLCASCAVPLGPGHSIKKQRFDVRYESGSPPAVAVSASYELANTGNRALDFLDVFLPAEKRTDLHLRVDGVEVTPAPIPDAADAGVRIVFAAPWPMKKKLRLTIEYRLLGEPGAVPSFQLLTGWYPQLQSPGGLFSRGGRPPEKWDVYVQVPQGFLVQASGRPRGSKSRSGEVVFRFQQRPESFDPYVVAGQYQEQRVTWQSADLRFWTFQPLGAEMLEAGNRLAATAKFYEATFGPRAEKPGPLWIVESPGPSASFPDGVLLALPTPAQLPSAERHLAEIWFGHILTPQLESTALLVDAFTVYAQWIAAEARGEAGARDAQVAALLADYRHAAAQIEEKPLVQFMGKSAGSEFGRSKGVLFFLALEDSYGREHVRKALARLITSLRGQPVNSNDLRVALTLETGQDPAEFFRVWLHMTGIPEDFRKRYEAAAESQRR